MNNKAGLYVHLPFCNSKCPYCDFLSISASDSLKLQYIDALKQELQAWSKKPETASLLFRSLYLGGGTPTVIQPRALVELIASALSLFQWVGQPEITMEANPESVAKDKLKIVKDAGINRISFGMQSMNEKGLKILGRLHNVSSAIKSFNLARQIGFNSVSVDLIYGWPSQTPEGWHKELEAILALRPDHVSCYELTLEPNTPFYKTISQGRLTLPDETIILEMMDIMEDVLKNHGYVHYEISNFALPTKECIHNLGYWNNLPYIGIGASAASYIPPTRMKQSENVHEYIKKIQKNDFSQDYSETLTHEQGFREAVIIGLRKVAGIDIKKLEAAWKINVLDYYGDTITQLINGGLLGLEDNQRLKLSKRGRRVSNVIFSKLV